MLVLSRQRDETIMIGDDIEITVVDIRGEKVRLGINAPAHVPVHRKEVYEAIKRENQAAPHPPGQVMPVESLAKRRQQREAGQAGSTPLPTPPPSNTHGK
jgi:carbon storage regulator